MTCIITVKNNTCMQCEVSSEEYSSVRRVAVGSSEIKDEDTVFNLLLCKEGWVLCYTVHV
jgi:hypothetical protein